MGRMKIRTLTMAEQMQVDASVIAREALGDLEECGDPVRVILDLAQMVEDDMQMAERCGVRIPDAAQKESAMKKIPKKLREVLRDPMQYIPAFVTIRNKNSEEVQLHPNPPQKKLYEIIKKDRDNGKPVRLIILKARQLGFSTFTEALYFYWAVTIKNTHTLIVAHRTDATRNLLRMNNLFYSRLPEAIKPMRAASNASEIILANPSRRPEDVAANPGMQSYIRCMTAADGIGRSDTTNNLHCSEIAFWKGVPKEILLGLIQSVPNTAGSCVIIESTANGYNYFRQLWYGAVRGDNGYTPVFFSWFDNPEYQMEPEAGTVWTKDETELARRHGLTERQLAWRRWCIKNNCDGDLDTFKQEYPSTPEEAFLQSGKPFFDVALIDALIEERTQEQKNEAPMVGGFTYDYDGLWITQMKWTEDSGGAIKIYKAPENGRSYTIGGDTAGEGSDWFCGQVIDSITKEKMATYHCQHDETAYTRQMYCLGMFYNIAMLAIECNFSTYPQRELERLGYENFYAREKMDSYTHKTVQSFGFRTSSRTRPVILARLHEFMDKEQGRPELERDVDTLQEMIVFSYDEKGKPQAIEGEHDDLVMAQAIALFCSDQAAAAAPAQKTETPTVQWTEDQWEDYQNASTKDRLHLIDIWGRPRGL